MRYMWQAVAGRPTVDDGSRGDHFSLGGSDILTTGRIQSGVLLRRRLRGRGQREEPGEEREPGTHQAFPRIAPAPRPTTTPTTRDGTRRRRRPCSCAQRVPASSIAARESKARTTGPHDQSPSSPAVDMRSQPESIVRRISGRTACADAQPFSSFQNRRSCPRNRAQLGFCPLTDPRPSPGATRATLTATRTSQRI